MLETYTTGFGKIQAEVGLIDERLKELKRKLKVLESFKSFNDMTPKELGNRDQEVQRVEEQINFLLRTKRELKAHLFAGEGGQANLRNNDTIN